ncbi:C-GCAxxG-C-C family (seleno)protein [Clostridium baratii]|uniref:C-GCAxxG-C-C family (seleno)protein n=1 Tax=Clostridium baratii TaxID=1561 RepID=UPI00097FB116|nr:C-GCAxxG-C-C family (seleno)protein [Clostridium baratii]AQM59016.1 hypothetical protein NPD11_1522 [Clostridium baratii]
MLIDKAIKLWDEKYDLNCAECILYAANEEYNLWLSKESLKIMSAFGGGMGIGSVCGAATGALAVIGIMFTNDRGHESPIVRQLSVEFMERFNEKFGSLDCRDIKINQIPGEKTCTDMIRTSANILEEIIRERKDYIKYNREGEKQWI